MIGKTLGRYQILAKLGAGGMGEVYRAHDERLDRDVAIKVLNSEKLEVDSNRKRFRKEALVLSKLNHPNIATILDFDSHDGVDFLVMEYIVGTTLTGKLENGPMPEKEIVPFAVQICDAMEDAHAFGVVHRDLKPSNIVVTPKGQIKVLDFGLAKMIEPVSHEAVTKATTESNLIVGTLPYMSPEQLLSEPVDARTDIYSFGVVLYEMSTGKLPHQATQPISLANAILNKIPQAPGQLRPDLSTRFQEIILKCIEKDRDQRYQSAKELSIDLRRLATPSMTLPEFSSRISRKLLDLKPRRLALFGGFILFVLLAVIAGLNYGRLRKSLVKTNARPEIQSVVALPSKVYGPDENRFLTDAIPNALSTHMSQVEGLETKLPPTSLDVERVGGDVNKIAQVYGANALIASTLTTDADQFTLNIQLIDANSRNLLWSRDYKGERKNYLELVHTAADGLRSALRPEGSPLQTGPTHGSTNAELLFQSGSYHLRSYANRKEPVEFDKALSDLKRTLDLDPTNARAAAAIARLYSYKIELGASLREVLPEIDRWAYRALQVDYRCGEAWQVLSLAEEMRPGGDKRKKLEYALKAATYAGYSGYSHHVLAVGLSPASFVLSLEASQEGIRQEPLHLNGLLFRSGILSREGRPKEALKLIDQVLAMEPGMPVAIILKDWLLLRDHQYDEAAKLQDTLKKMVAERRLHPGWVDFAQNWFEFEKSLGTNQKKIASEKLEQLVNQARGDAPPFPRWEVVTGNVLSIQAQNDSAASTLETLSRRAEKGIFEPYDWLLLNPEMETVRKDKRFGTLIVRSRNEFQEMLKVLEEARSRNELPAYLEKPLAQVRDLR